MVRQVEHIEHPDKQGTFLLLNLLTRVAFKLDASYSFINASCVIDLGLKVEAFREARCGCSSLGCRLRVDQIGRDCEIEISEILLVVDPRGGGIALSRVWVHGDIASSRIWVHGMVIHHSGGCGLSCLWDYVQ